MEILDLYYETQHFWNQSTARGKHPSVSRLDSIIALMSFYHTGIDYAHLSAQLHIKPTALRNAIDRVRSIVNKTLSKRFWENRRHPIAPPFPGLEGVALLVDTSNYEVYHSCDFRATKSTFDAKNRIYALKKEVAVMSTPPYLALFFPAIRDRKCSRLSYIQGG